MQFPFWKLTQFFFKEINRNLISRRFLAKTALKILLKITAKETWHENFLFFWKSMLNPDNVQFVSSLKWNPYVHSFYLHVLKFYYKQPPQVFYQKVFLKNFAKSTGKKVYDHPIYRSIVRDWFYIDSILILYSILIHMHSTQYHLAKPLRGYVSVYVHDNKKMFLTSKGSDWCLRDTIFSM